MKPLINLFFVIFMAIALITGCEKDGPNNEEPLTLKGNVISNTGCKTSQIEGDQNYIPDTLSCIEYSFDSENNILSISHFNAGFDCGQIDFYCDISIRNDTLFIEEFQSGPPAECACIYDLEIELSGVEANKYQVEIKDRYAQMTFEMDLIGNNQGTYCVTRKNYPWG